MKYPLPFFIFLLAMASIAGAHEVYVLDSEQIEHGINSKSVNPFSAIKSRESSFVFWGLLSFAVVGVVFLVSISKKLEKKLDPFLISLKPYASLFSRIAIGTSFLASAIYDAMFGPELPLQGIFGEMHIPIRIAMFVIGLCLTVGFLSRLNAIVALILFSIGTVVHGDYMIGYANYVGDIIVVILIGSEKFSADTLIWNRKAKKGISQLERSADKVLKPYHKYNMLILRIFFGVGTFYASWWAKYTHTELSIMAVTEYNLTQFFPFDPLFLVLGALIIQSVLSIFIIVGFEIRFTSIFTLVFLTLSILFFKEAVWPHIVLYGTIVAILLAGYDKYTVEKMFYKEGKVEPVL